MLLLLLLPPLPLVQAQVVVLARPLLLLPLPYSLWAAVVVPVVVKSQTVLLLGLMTVVKKLILLSHLVPPQVAQQPVPQQCQVSASRCHPLNPPPLPWLHCVVP